MRTAKRMATTRRELQQRDERKFLACGGVFARWGGASMDMQLLLQKVDGAGSLIARLIRAVSGGDHGPDVEAAAMHLDRALASGAATLGGAILKIIGRAVLGVARAGRYPWSCWRCAPGRGSDHPRSGYSLGWAFYPVDRRRPNGAPIGPRGRTVGRACDGVV